MEYKCKFYIINSGVESNGIYRTLPKNLLLSQHDPQWFFFSICAIVSIFYTFKSKLDACLVVKKPTITKNGEFLPVMKRIHMNYLYLFQVLGEVLVSHK